MEQILEAEAALRADAGPIGTWTVVEDAPLAAKLVELGRLNRWQAEQLKVGRAKFNLGPYQVIDSIGQGGMGQVFAATTNPAVSTGDGVALALRAGAEVCDLEFMQFHPTVLYLGRNAEGQQPLVSEAVRGEGAHLVDGDGVRFMVGRHELAELAPRDVVAKGIFERMRDTGTEHMYLDGRAFGAQMWMTRFPTILAACREHGIDPVTEPIPVAPAAHYASGGVRTDLRGRTRVNGLYACGEVACTGVHGANRLASNSLLEGLVFAERIAADIAERRAAVPRAPVAASARPS